MASVDGRKGHDPVNDRAIAWRPWHRQEFEFIQGCDISTPPRRHFSPGAFLLVALQAGTSENQYRNTRTSDQGRAGVFRVFEPEESWICRPQRTTFQTLMVDASWLRRIAPDLVPGERALPHFPSRCFFDPGLSRTFRELAGSSLASVSRLEQDGLLLPLFARLLLHGEEPRALPRLGWEHPAVKRAKEYLRSHYADEVSLRDLAKVASLSPFHLARVFRQAVGVPPHAYQMQLRLNRARTLLARGFNVGYVAQETGFYDQCHFARQFRRYFFVKPSLYGKTARVSSSTASLRSSDTFQRGHQTI